jgi:hypothetical protein
MKESYCTRARISSKTVILNIISDDSAARLQTFLQVRALPGGIIPKYGRSRWLKSFGVGLVMCLLLVCAQQALGQAIRVGPDGEATKQTLSLPYAFYNESFGFAVGYVYGIVGSPQKQTTLLATAMAGTKGSAMGFLVGRDIQMPRVERLFFDPIVSIGYFKDNEVFVDGNPDFPDERLGQFFPAHF